MLVWATALGVFLDGWGYAMWLHALFSVLDSVLNQTLAILLLTVAYLGGLNSLWACKVLARCSSLQRISLDQASSNGMETSLICQHMIRLHLATSGAHPIATCRNQKLTFVPEIFDARNGLKPALMLLYLLLLLLYCIMINLSDWCSDHLSHELWLLGIVLPDILTIGVRLAARG